MSVGRTRDGQMNRITKRELEQILAQFKGAMKVKDIIKLKCSDPDAEFQRPRAWSISQGLAELHRDRVVDIFSAADHKTGKDVMFVMLRGKL
jgi:hypothetical protein